MQLKILVLAQSQFYAAKTKPAVGVNDLLKYKICKCKGPMNNKIYENFKT